MTHLEPEDTGGRLDHLVESLGERNWRSRQRAVGSLAAVDSVELVGRVLDIFRHHHQDFSRLNAAIQVLATTPVDVVPALLTLLTDHEPDLRSYSALALGLRGDPRSIPALLVALSDPETNVRVHAMEALGKLRAAAAVEKLTEIVESRDFELAFPALDALREIGDESVASRLVPLLQQSLLQSPTIDALGALGDETTVAALLRLLDQPAAPLGLIAQAICRIHQRQVERYGSGTAVENTVGRISNPEWLPIVLSAIPNASPSEALSLISMVNWLPGAEAGAGLIALLDVPLRFAECIEALANSGMSKLPALVRRLERLGGQSEPAFVELFGQFADPRPVSALLPLLQSEDEELLTAALKALQGKDDGSLFQHTKVLLGHESPRVREAAVSALSSAGFSLATNEWRELLHDPSPLVRESAVRVLSDGGPAESLVCLLECCEDSDEQVRRSAIERLPVVNDGRVSEHLFRALRTDSPKVRAAAAGALGEVEHPQVAPLLEQALRDEDVWVRYFAVRSLSVVDVDRRAFEPLAALAMSDPATQVRIVATESLVHYGPQSLPGLMHLSKEIEIDVARAAVLALGNLRLPESLPALLSIDESAEPELRIAAIHALAASDQPSAVGRIAEVAHGSDKELADEAIAALGKIPLGSSVDALLDVATYPAHRDAILTAFVEIGRTQINLLASRLPQVALDVRRLAVEALSRLRTEEAIGVLETALKDPEPAVRHAAFSALLHIRHTSRPAVTAGDEQGVR